MGVPSESISVREAGIDDAASLLQLWQELMRLHRDLNPRFALAERSAERFLAYLDLARSREDYRVWVAEGPEGPVGFVVACVLPNSPVYAARWIGYINDLCVTAAWRGHGVGRSLVEAAMAWLWKHGADTIEVYVAQQNEDALRFWRRMGGRDYLQRLTLGPMRGEGD